MPAKLGVVKVGGWLVGAPDPILQEWTSCQITPGNPAVSTATWRLQGIKYLIYVSDSRPRGFCTCENQGQKGKVNPGQTVALRGLTK